MKILAFDSTTKTASVALYDDGRLLAEYTLNNGNTHSETLLPMAETILRAFDLRPCEVESFAVSVGPGSFTGVRIGVATVKGLALGADKPCVGVSTLEAMAHGLAGIDGVYDCVMDARAGQVYHARFRRTGEVLERLCPDRAVTIDELGAEIGEAPEILVGDGADLCYNKLKPVCPALRLAPPHLRWPSAYGVAMAALPKLEAGETLSPQALDAVYLRKPQAEQMRDRMQKQAKS